MTMIERKRGEVAGLAHFHLLRLLKGKRAVVIAAAERTNLTGKGHLL
jgi:hypothetical protein